MPRRWREPAAIAAEIDRIRSLRQIASIRDDLTRLATEPVSESSVGRRTERIRRVLTELNDALTLGDDILRELRPLLSPKHQATLTRA